MIIEDLSNISDSIKNPMYKYSKQLSDESNAIAIPINNNFQLSRLTVHLLNVRGGLVTVEYSLSEREEVENDTANWRRSKLRNITTNRGVSSLDLVRFLRVVRNSASQNVSYNLEVLVGV